MGKWEEEKKKDWRGINKWTVGGGKVKGGNEKKIEGCLQLAPSHILLHAACDGRSRTEMIRDDVSNGQSEDAFPFSHLVVASALSQQRPMKPVSADASAAFPFTTVRQLRLFRT